MAYSDVVLGGSPLVYYRLDGTVGRTVDSSGNGRTLTANGSNFTNRSALIDASDGSCEFDNGTATGNLTLADSSPVDFPGNAVFTVEAWVKLVATPDSTYRRLLTWTDESDSGTNCYGLGYQDSFGFFALRRTAGTDAIAGGLPLGGFKLAESYYLVMRYDGTNLYLYINGRAYSPVVSSGSQGAYAGSLLVGAGQFGGSSCKAIIDEVAIYSTQLSDAEIYARYAEGRSQRAYSKEVFRDLPRAYYRMSEASGLIQDSSGWANHATSTSSGGAGAATYAETGAIPSDAAENKAIKIDPNFRFNIPDGDALDLSDGPFAIEMWWKFDTAGLDQWPISKGAGGYEIRINADNTFSLVKSATSLTVTSTSAIPNDGAFHHLVATKFGASVKLYLDKVDVTGTVDNSTYGDTTDDLQIGGYNAGSDRFVDGWVDEVALYVDNLSATRVAAHYDAAPIPAGPAGRFITARRRGR